MEIVGQLARDYLGPNASVYGYGSSMNACGEAQSDVDMVIFYPEVQDDDARFSPAFLSTLKDAAEEHPQLSVLTHRPDARIPILSLELLSQQGSSTGYTCDVSLGIMLPLYNTRLLRTYAELAPALPVLAVVVKRWAKAHSIALTYTGHISSYSWTLTMVYYLQICHGLPSLHALAPQRTTARSSGPKRFNTDFVKSKVEAIDSMVAAAASSGGVPLINATFNSTGLGDLLRGFFKFYSEEFGWNDEVVSPRLGTRRKRGKRGFSEHLAHTRIKLRGSLQDVDLPPFLNIEDPIEVQKNLNFALDATTAGEIREALLAAHSLLSADPGAPDILHKLLLRTLRDGDSSTPVLQPGQLVQEWLQASLPPPPLDREGQEKWSCRCFRCGSFFKTFIARWEHENAYACKTALPLFRCPVCTKGFANREDCYAHQEASGHDGTPKAGRTKSRYAASQGFQDSDAPEE